MPRGAHKSKRSSGFHHRKIRKAKEEALKENKGSILRFVKLSGKSQQPDDEAGIFESNSTLDVLQVQPSS